jgi:hypothetical protein
MKYISHISLPFIFTLLFSTVSCQNVPQTNQTIELATVAENKVQVTITLSTSENGQSVLSAIFAPQDPSLHLYSKDIPKTGLEGLGRPTLLELTEGSAITASGQLSESVQSQPLTSGPADLLVYPQGVVTLSMPVRLPNGSQWINDQVQVTYMACNEQGCHPPVEEKIIQIQIPGRDLIQTRQETK